MNQKKSIKNKKWNPIKILLILVGILVISIIAYKYNYNKNLPPLPVPAFLTTFTLEEVVKYNGQDPTLPIYMVYDGLVYDVTGGKDFYGTGNAYNYLTGRDVTEEINSVGLGDTIKRKYPVIGKISIN